LGGDQRTRLVDHFAVLGWPHPSMCG